jgi:hypothetical protein
MYFKRKERGSEFTGECRGVVVGLRGDHFYYDGWFVVAYASEVP